MELIKHIIRPHNRQRDCLLSWSEIRYNESTSNINYSGCLCFPLWQFLVKHALAYYSTKKNQEADGEAKETPSVLKTLNKMIDVSKLKEEDKGRLVTYQAHIAATPEHGRITSWNETYIFVDYQNVGRGQATPASRLTFQHEETH